MKHEIGETVLIKMWSEMAEEFGLTPDGCIPVEPYGFCRQMEDELQGRTRCVVITFIGENFYWVRLAESSIEWRRHHDNVAGRCGFYITDNMLKENK